MQSSFTSLLNDDEYTHVSSSSIQVSVTEVTSILGKNYAVGGDQSEGPTLLCGSATRRVFAYPRDV